jgi:hypothetical protein
MTSWGSQAACGLINFNPTKKKARHTVQRVTQMQASKVSKYEASKHTHKKKGVAHTKQDEEAKSNRGYKKKPN